MTRPALTNKRVLLLLVLLMVLSSLLPPGIARGVAKYPAQIVGVPVQPFAHALTAFSGWLRPGETLSVPLGEQKFVENENLQLQGQVIRLQEELRKTRERLDAVSDVHARVGDQVQVVEARVTEQPRRPGEETIKVNRGSSQGVRENLAVVAGPHLVGVVEGVTPVWSTVRLINFPKTVLKVAIRPPVQPTYELRANAEVSPDGRAFFATVGINDSVQEEDLAFLIDDYWPPESRGSTVGKVVRVEEDPSDPKLRKRVVISPLHPLDAHTYVQILVTPPGAANDEPTQTGAPR